MNPSETEDYKSPALRRKVGDFTALAEAMGCRLLALTEYSTHHNVNRYCLLCERKSGGYVVFDATHKACEGYAVAEEILSWDTYKVHSVLPYVAAHTIEAYSVLKASGLCLGIPEFTGKAFKSKFAGYSCDEAGFDCDIKNYGYT